MPKLGIFGIDTLSSRLSLSVPKLRCLSLCLSSRLSLSVPLSLYISLCTLDTLSSRLPLVRIDTI
jgi:hypothetical protein